MSILDDKIYIVDGVKCLTIDDYASTVMRSRSTITSWIMHGNRFRKLKVLRTTNKNKPFIPVDELWEFPITIQGRDQSRVYRMMETPEGKMTYARCTVYCGLDKFVRCDHKCETCDDHKEITYGDSSTVQTGDED